MAKWFKRTKLPRYRKNCKHKQRTTQPILPRPSTSGSSLLKTGGTLLSAVALSTQLLATPLIAAEQQPGQSGNLFDGRRIAATKTNSGITTSTTLTPTMSTKETPYGNDQKLTGGTADLSFEKDGWWRFGLGGYYNADTMRGEMRLATSMSLLYAASKLGTYVSYEKGKDFDKFLVAEGFKVPGGKVLITGALLKRLVEISFSESAVRYTPQLQQKALGIDYTAGFSKEGLIEEIKTSLIFFDVDGKNLGSIGTIVLEDTTQFDQTRVYGGVRGGNKLLGEASIALRLAKWLRVDLGAGGERRQFDAMFDKGKDTRTSAVWTVKLTFQPNEHHRLKLSGSLSDLQRQGAANYTVDFGYYLQAFVEGSYYDNRQAGIEPERKLMAGFTITLDAGGKKSKLAPLYADLKDRDDLKLPDLVPTSRIITSQIEVMERVSYNQHEIRIDKTMLPGSSYLEKNADGSLRALNLDTGATNLVSVSSINYSQHAPFFSVTGWRYLRIVNFEKLTAPATYRVALLDSIGTNTLVQFTTTAGSVELTSSIETLNGVSNTNAAAFVSGTQTIQQIRAAMATPQNRAPVATFSSFTATEDQTFNGQLSATDADGDTLTFALTAHPAHGTMLLQPNGAFSYIPAPDYYGSDSFSFSVSDGKATATQSVTITVNNVNDAPLFGSALTPLNLAQRVLMTPVVLPIATDADNDPLTYSVSWLPEGLGFDPASRTISGTPTSSGSSTVSYSVTDGKTTTLATFSAVVIAVADTTPDAFSFVDQTNVAKSTLTESAAITVSGINTATAISVTGGEYSINGGAWTSTAGTVTNGQTVKVRQTSSALNNTATNTVLTIGGVGDTFTTTTAATAEVPPVMGDVPNQTYTFGSVITNHNIGNYVTLTNGDAITGYTLTGTLPTGLTFNSSTGVLSGTPTQTGTFTLSVTATDKDGASNSDSFTIVVTAAADTTPPVTSSAPAISVAAADTTVSVTQSINENGTGYYLMLPVASAAPSVNTVVTTGSSFAMTGSVATQVNITGLTASTAYKYYFVAKDAVNNTQAAVSAGLAITTTAAADTTPPVATAETVSTAYNTALNGIDVLANDTDNSGTVLLGAISSQVGGTFTAVAGKINFTPTNGFSGAASCVYQVKDPSNNISTATLTVNVAAADITPPVYVSNTLVLWDNTAWGSSSGTITFDENVTFVSASYSNWWSVAYVSWNWTNTLTISYTNPNTPWTSTITVNVKDTALNPATKTINKSLALANPTGLSIVGNTLSWNPVTWAWVYVIYDYDMSDMDNQVWTSLNISAYKSWLITVVADDGTWTYQSSATIYKP